MRIKDFMKRAVVAMLTAAMMVTPIASVHAATTDVIDTSKTGSITIHKYDMTAAKRRRKLRSVYIYRKAEHSGRRSLKQICCQRR